MKQTLTFLLCAAAAALAGLSCSENGETSKGDLSDLSPVEDAGGCASLDGGNPGEISWVAIPAGSFTMGCSPNDTDCYSTEKPAHAVAVAAFELTRTEITQSQYKALIGKEPSTFTCCPSCPVDSVTWTESKAFCEKMGARLPSEAEWEYAARAGSTSRYVCGDDSSCLDGVAWYKDSSGLKTHPVATKTANTFGLHDMLGNVWEWVADHWHEDYSGAPASSIVWTTGGNESYRVLRGGCYGLTAKGMRVSNREYDYPDSYLIAPPGFRCARAAGTIDAGVSDGAPDSGVSDGPADSTLPSE